MRSARRSLAELHQKKKLFSVRDHVEEQEKARREEEARAIEQRRLAGANCATPLRLCSSGSER